MAVLCVLVVWPSLPGLAVTKKGTAKPGESAKASTKKATPDDEGTARTPKPKRKPRVVDEEDTPAANADKGKTKPASTDKDSGAGEAETKPAGEPAKKVHAPSASLEPSDLVEFDAQPPRVQQLITAALALTKLNLTYIYGSADPTQGGLDCSGTIYYTLRAQGFADVPRDSSGQYVWVRKNGGFEAVVSTSATSFEFDALHPGDLMFWSGTYSVEREIPVTHVMMYLGHEKKTKQRVMFGASDGRSYQGVQRWGVSVFDFKMPKADATRGTNVDFLGYGPIPGLRGAAREVAAAEPVKPAPKEESAAEPEVPVRKSAGKTTGKATGQAGGSSVKSPVKKKKR